jgi:hypothetical protein
MKYLLALLIFLPLCQGPVELYAGSLVSVSDSRYESSNIETRAASAAWQRRMIEQKDYYLSINSPYLNTDQQKSNYQHLLMQSGYSVIAGIGAMVYLWNQPTSFTNWDKREEQDFVTRYRANVSSKPRFDDDDFVTNYIGHPLAGATYYVMARQNALSWYSSFFYSFLMSTFYWEYGLEAFAEVPSSQDLVVTPVVGSMIGELMHQAKQRVKLNNNTIAGSHTLGRFALWILDPLGHFTSGIHYSILGESKLYLAPDVSSQSAHSAADQTVSQKTKMGIKLVFASRI